MKTWSKQAQPDELEQFLNQESSVGQVESAGVFTVAGDAAVGKLAAFQLPRKSAWVLKVVQAAVASRAGSLDIQQKVDASFFVFEPAEPLTVQELQAAILGSVQAAVPALEHLASGLRAVGFGDKRHFTLALEADGWQYLLWWDGKQLMRRDQQGVAVERPRLRLGVAYPRDDRGRRIGGLMRGERAGEEYLELVRHACACPIPLRVDGRRLDNLERYKEKGGLKTFSSLLLCLAWSDQPQSGVAFGLPQGLPSEGEGWRPTDKFTDKRPFKVVADSGADGVKSLWRLDYHYRIESHRSKYKSFQFNSVPEWSMVRWLKDGVVVHQEMLKTLGPTAVTLTAYLCADDLPTDLSGLQLRQSEQMDIRQREALRSLVPALPELGRGISNHKPLPFGMHAALWGGIGLAALTAIPSFGKTVFGVVSAAQLLLSAHDKRQIVKECEHQLDVFANRLRRVL